MNNRDHSERCHKIIKQIIAYFGHQAFMDKSVLDLGCGTCDISGALARLGARVIAVDARQEHLNIAKKKYPHLTIIKADLDREFPFKNQKFDFVLAIDILCHLSNHKQLLEQACDIGHNIIVDSEICDSHDPARIIKIDEHKSIANWAFNGVGTKPSAINIENILKDSGMAAKRLDIAELNTNSSKYNWQVTGSDKRVIGNRRFWIAVKEREVDRGVRIPKLAAPSPIIAVQKPVSLRKYKHANKSALKIAVCLSGHLRTFERTSSLLHNNLIKNFNCDVFIHTWNTIGSENSKGGSDRNSSKEDTISKLAAINRCYNPKKISIEQFEREKFFNLAQGIHIPEHEKQFVVGHLGYHFAMFYSIKQVNELLKETIEAEHIKYDYVIRIRPDIMLQSKIDHNMVIHINNKIVLPIAGQYCANGINDQIAIGRPDTMNVYCSMFDHIAEYCRQHKTTLRPEALLYYHLLKNGINFDKKHILFDILRMDGSIVRQ